MTQEMRDLLARASVVAEGPAMNWGSRTSHGKASATILSRDGRSLFEEMHDRFSGAHTDDQIRRVTAWAKVELHRAKRTPQPENGMAEPWSTPWKREIAAEADKARGEGEKAKEHIGRIAKKFSVSRASVYRFRAEYSEKDVAA